METITLVSFIIGIAGFCWGIATWIYTYRKTRRLYDQLRRVAWDEIRLGSRELRAKFEHDFQPTVIFAPCRRGATIANLMFDTGENILLHVGIRIDKRDKNQELSTNLPAKDWKIVETDKYFHYIPRALVDFLRANKEAKLLILDDFAMTGDSLKGFVDFFESHDVKRENIRTIAIVGTRASLEGKNLPDLCWFKTTEERFYFPWGKAI